MSEQLGKLKELFPIEVFENNTPRAFFINVDKSEGDSWEWSLYKNDYPVGVYDSEIDAYLDIESLLGSLTLHKDAWIRSEPYSHERAANKIAASSRRGIGNTDYKNYLFYHGITPFDRIVSIGKNDSNYFVFLNPKAETMIEKFDHE